MFSDLHSKTCLICFYASKILFSHKFKNSKACKSRFIVEYIWYEYIKLSFPYTTIVESRSKYISNVNFNKFKHASNFFWCSSLILWWSSNVNIVLRISSRFHEIKAETRSIQKKTVEKENTKTIRFRRELQLMRVQTELSTKKINFHRRELQSMRAQTKLSAKKVNLHNKAEITAKRATEEYSGIRLEENSEEKTKALTKTLRLRIDSIESIFFHVLRRIDARANARVYKKTCSPKLFFSD